MSDDRSSFDPRFDPAFQRGFEGTAAERPRVPENEKKTPAPPADLEPAPAVQRVQEQLFEEVDIDEDESRGINPFLIALGALSVALLVGGGVLFSRLDDIFANTASDFGYVKLQSLTVIAPVAMGLGVAAGLGVLFIYAIRWGRSR